MAKTETKQPGTIVNDPEMKAMVKIVAQMNALDDAQKHRVLHWLVAKFGKPLVPQVEKEVPY